MKILQVTPRYAPNTGGVETHVQEVSERLVERGHDVIVVTADAGPDVQSRVVKNGVRIRRHRGFALNGAFHVAPGIKATVRRVDADVIHAHNYHSLPLFFAALGATDERFVVTPHYHGASASGVRDQLLSLYRPFGRWALRRADAVVAVSEWEQERLHESFSVDATVIPNGLDVRRFANAEPEERERPYLLCVGRLEKYKGVQYAIRALEELPEYDLVVVGDGPYGDELDRIARDANVAGRVEFHGYVDHDTLPTLYAGAEAYLSLSKFEAYGMTVAEALAAGTPCVVLGGSALDDWTYLDGCTGVSDLGAETVAAAAEEATAEPEIATDIPSWDDISEALVEVYGSPPSIAE